MTKHIALIAAAALGFSSACSSADGSSSSAKTRDLELVLQCAGSYSCIFTALEQTDPGAAIVSDNELAFANNVCSTALFNLYPNGTVVFNAEFEQPPGTWTGDRDEFSACFSDSKFGCVNCSLTAGASAPASRTSVPQPVTGYCEGGAQPCNERNEPDCTELSGCMLVLSDTPGQDFCTGAPTPCSGFDGPDVCNLDSGCWWNYAESP
ncbi:MAG TPA: hypothetical protein VHV51_23340 [Polyangiaceae bacterium]|jgi:hypothetical protein|nr:hypothetical protein [Polyangiaceae bacterium]